MLFFEVPSSVIIVHCHKFVPMHSSFDDKTLEDRINDTDMCIVQNYDIVEISASHGILSGRGNIRSLSLT